MTWYDTDYSYKKKITIDNTKVSGDETDFPVLISVTDGDLADEANGGHVKSANGYDIIFTNGAETVKLKHEIERYVNTNGLLIYWVKVPSLSSTPPSTDIYIYYGKVGVGADPSSTDTWDSNFLAVYHMDDTDGTCDDSTSNANDGAYQSTLPNRVASKIGYGQEFDGSSDYISLPSGTFITTAVTYECWYEADVTNVQQNLFTERHDVNNWINTYQLANGQYQWHLYTSGFDFNIGGGARTTNFEKHAYTYQVNDAEIRVNKASIATDNSFPVPVGWTYELVYVGTNRTANGSWADGIVDEVRISDIRRSNNWLDTTYETQNDPAAFMSWAEEEAFAVGADIFYHDGTNNIELQRDNSSPVQIFNGTTIIGLKLGETNDPNASPIHIFDGTTIKAILKMP